MFMDVVKYFYRLPAGNRLGNEGGAALPPSIAKLTLLQNLLLRGATVMFRFLLCVSFPFYDCKNLLVVLLYFSAKFMNVLCKCRCSHFHFDADILRTHLS
jgi:hypothetical protein